MASHPGYNEREDAHRNRLAGRVDDVSMDGACGGGEYFLFASSRDGLRLVQYLRPLILCRRPGTSSSSTN